MLFFHGPEKKPCTQLYISYKIGTDGIKISRIKVCLKQNYQKFQASRKEIWSNFYSSKLFLPRCTNKLCRYLQKIVLSKIKIYII